MSIGKAVGLALAIQVCASSARGAGPGANGRALAPLQIRVSPTTGLATFVTARGGGRLTAPPAAAQQRARPIDVLRQYGRLFGVTDADHELRAAKTETDGLGSVHSTFHQVHRGIAVFSGVLKVHEDRAGDPVAINGHFYTIPPQLSLQPVLTAQQAAAVAGDQLGVAGARVIEAELVIVDPAWYGDPPAGVRLAYYIVLDDSPAGASEAFFVDAHKGIVLDEWSLIHDARVRMIYDGGGTPALPGALVRSEGEPPSGDFDIDAAYDYYGDTYDYYFRAFGRDGIDGAGLTMVATAHSTAPNCPNAFWSDGLLQMVFCTGTVTDDVVAHELTHGVTHFSANLIYQNQSGQLNESFSDVFGEMVDLFNGNAAFPGAPGGTPWPPHATGPGLDVPNNPRGGCSLEPAYVDGVRWLLGEDAAAFGGAIRDMWNPPCEGDPDGANSKLQTCPGFDNGGVHSGSGVPNHAFAMVVDGATFNGFTVDPIGPIKAAAVWYRALTVYLTVAADFQDAYAAFNQAAADLIGTTPDDPRTGLPSGSVFTAADAQQVDKALLAVEMNTAGACGATVSVLDSSPAPQCAGRSIIFADDFEGGPGGWTVSNSSPPTVYDWQQLGDLPFDRPGTAWFCADPGIGDCAGDDESGLHSLISPPIVLPPVVGRPTLAFTHYLETEPVFDGGRLSVRVNSGVWQGVPAAAFTFNAYNADLMAAYQGNTSPLAGESSWTGVGGEWGTSVVDLGSFVTGGDLIELRFDFSKDGCGGFTGWWLDDLEIYDCTCSVDADCSTASFCDTAVCAGGLCQPTAGPCRGGFCHESNDACLFGVAFHDDFEAGNSQGWDLFAAGSTASSGVWTLGVPQGTASGPDAAQPNVAFEGWQCAFTAQNSSLGRDDVDEGVTYLVSPVIDLAGAASAQLSYARWYYNRDRDEDPDDFFAVDASDDGGGTWVNLETLGLHQSSNVWTPRAFALEDFIDLTSTVRLRFGAADGVVGGGSIIEAAVDDVLVQSFQACSVAGDCADGEPCTTEACAGGLCEIAPHLYGDLDRDHDVDLADILCVLDGFEGNFIACEQSEVDLAPCNAPDGAITLLDILAVLDAFSGTVECPCP